MSVTKEKVNKLIAKAKRTGDKKLAKRALVARSLIEMKEQHAKKSKD